MVQAKALRGSAAVKERKAWTQQWPPYLLRMLVPLVQSEALRRPRYRQTDGVAKKEEANNNSRQPQRGGLLQKAEPERMPQPPKGRPS